MLVIGKHKYRDIPARSVSPSALGLFVPVMDKPPVAGEEGVWYDHSSSPWYGSDSEPVYSHLPRAVQRVVVREAQALDLYPGWYRLQLETRSDQ